MSKISAGGCGNLFRGGAQFRASDRRENAIEPLDDIHRYRLQSESLEFIGRCCR